MIASDFQLADFVLTRRKGQDAGAGERLTSVCMHSSHVDVLINSRQVCLMRHQIASARPSESTCPVWRSTRCVCSLMDLNPEILPWQPINVKRLLRTTPHTQSSVRAGALHSASVRHPRTARYQYANIIICTIRGVNLMSDATSNADKPLRPLVFLGSPSDALMR